MQPMPAAGHSLNGYLWSVKIASGEKPAQSFRAVHGLGDDIAPHMRFSSVILDQLPFAGGVADGDEPHLYRGCSVISPVSTV